MNPSTADLVEAVEAVRSDDVVSCPTTTTSVPVADAGVRSGHQIGTGSSPPSAIVEGFAALLAYDPEAEGAVNAGAMEASAAELLPAK